MTTNTNNLRVASVGSPSSNYEIILRLAPESRHYPLVGSVVFLVNPMGDGEELALGSVTQVTTTNRLLEIPQMQPALAAGGEVRGWTGDAGDLRDATIRVQAAWRRETKSDPWKSSGPSLRMSPATGTEVYVLDNDTVQGLVETNEDIHYLGHLLGSDGVRLPMSLPDFAGDMGAWHGGLFGMTGSGKTAMSCYLIAGQLRHEDMGFIIVDPQGQWASEEGLAFSLQGFAAELGRPVRVRRISDDLRLQKDSDLLIDLLRQTHFTKDLHMKDQATTESFWYETKKFFDHTDNWERRPSREMLSALLAHLREEPVASRIYLTPERAQRFIERVTETDQDERSFSAAYRNFAPVHNLFQPVNASGDRREEVSAAFTEIFSQEQSGPKPILILDMSSRGSFSLDDINIDAEDYDQILGRDDIKATILRSIFANMKKASERQFGEGVTLNTLVVLDEAWRYAAPTANETSLHIAELSKELAGYARDTRKFGIGWFFISQSPRNINPDIWAQLSLRLFGNGLSGADLEKMVDIIDSRDSLQLYRMFAPPSATRKWPFMLVGPGSPLAVTNAPVTFNAYSDFDEFRRDNERWISRIRKRLGGEPVMGPPSRPHGRPASGANGKKAPKAIRKALTKSGMAASENRKSLGLLDTAGFVDPTSDIDDAPF
jgi:hypothetical protein